MKLSNIELRAMDYSWWRRWGEENFEFPLFERIRLDIRNRDGLETGCENSHGIYLLNQGAPRGIDLKLFDLFFHSLFQILESTEWKNI
jgi:hypothetical protein